MLLRYYEAGNLVLINCYLNYHVEIVLHIQFSMITWCMVILLIYYIAKLDNSFNFKM